ncbi:MAG: NAD(P)/FAD-dependent oxidoreductase [Oscillospiraceae bacterium]|nr:NAD(P)/FAD-dependent oxidoreductase [Oscillospiraceae bacterium]
MNYDVIIIGCGVTGASCAYTLAQHKLRVGVLEASNDVANGTTKANSAIVHAGYDPETGTKMAQLNVRGAALMGELCRRLDVPYANIGSLVLSLSEQDDAHVQELYARGRANGVPGLQMISGDEARAMDPGVSPATRCALWAPSAGIVNPWELCYALAETAVRNGAELHLSAPVTAIERTEGGYRIRTPKGDFTAPYVINCAGTHSDRIAGLVGDESFRILPTKGEYFLLDKSEGHRVEHVIFQCPSELGKGVLVAPTVHGNLLVGPDAQPTTPDDTANSAAGLAFVRASALRSVPGVNFRDNIRNFAGVRANSDHEDFIIGESAVAPGFFHFAGIRSPGLSAAPAFGEEALRLLKAAGLKVEQKEEYIDTRRRVRFQELSEDEKNEMIRKDPRWGRVICRCETVTEGEIVAALHTPIPPVSVNGVKRRVGAGMGRCQGGFCGPRVQEIIARELGIDPTRVLMDWEGTWVLCGETKGGAKA